MIVFNINMDVLSQLTSNSGNDKESIYIFDENNALVFASNGKDATFDIHECKKVDDSNINLKTSKDVYTFAKSFENFDCVMVSEYDMSHFLVAGYKTTFVLLLLIVLAVILAFSIAVYMSFHFYNSISSIMAAFSTLGAPLPASNAEAYDEIKFITDNILQNSTSKAQIEQELTQKILLLQKAQTIALQTQFTPHFLFNTLNHISVTLMNTISRDNVASHMISIMADLLTIALDTKEYTTDIKSEITYAKKYIELEEIKYDNNFDVTWDIDESLYGYTTPKLILQPILENCLKHGINPLRHKRRGEIHISVQRQDDDILFCIRDNGVGITDERLKEIQARLAQNDIPETRHIGLCNVHQRIQLLFKAHYGCTIQSTAPGVTVSICMPCKSFSSHESK